MPAMKTIVCCGCFQPTDGLALGMQWEGDEFMTMTRCQRCTSAAVGKVLDQFLAAGKTSDGEAARMSAALVAFLDKVELPQAAEAIRRGESTQMVERSILLLEAMRDGRIRFAMKV